MIIKVGDYSDFKAFVPGGPSEQFFHFETPGYFVAYSRTITVMATVVEYKAAVKPATYSTDFPGSIALNFPLDVE